MKKKSLTTLMALFISISAYGKEENKAILVEDVSLQHLQDTEKGHICKADMNKNLKQKLKKDAYLIGQMRTTPTPDQKGVVQIVWTGIQVKDKKRPKAYFKKPLISTFKANSPALAKGTQITLIGDTDQISQALEDLDKGQASQNAQGLDHNPQAAERRVDDARTTHGQRSGHRGNTMQGGGAGDGSGYDQGQTSYQGDHLNSDMNSGTAKGSQGNAGSGYGQSAYSNGGVASGTKSSSNQRPFSNRSYGFTPGRMASSRMYGDGSFNTATPFTTSASSSKSPQHENAQGSNAEQSATNGEQKGQSQNNNGDSVNPEGTQGRDPLGVDRDPAEDAKRHQFKKFDVEITEQGCRPRIDFEKGQCIIQTKSITRKDGRIIRESPCSDSETWYPIKKDYSNCQDEIDAIRRVAYTRFQRYWQDKDGNKNYLDSSCIRDESQPHPFIDDVKNCAHFLDILGGKAWRQAETYYYDRANAKQMVASCHKVSEPLPIVEVSHKCKPKHLFEKKLSIIQKRSIFMDNGIEHEVLPCRESDQTVPHEFIKAGCTPVVKGNTAIPMVKRQIRYNGKTHQITNDCEPLNPVALMSSVEGCENQFFDDFNAGRSYQAIRWYFLWNNKKKFVTPCQRSDKYYVHELQFLGFQNRDDLCKAQPRSLVTITVNGKTVSLRTILETNPQKFIDYVNQGSETRSTGANSDRIYYQTFTLWKRPDGSTYAQPGASWSVELPKPQEGYGYHEYNDHCSTRGW